MEGALSDRYAVVRILFTKSNKIGSRVIRFVTGDSFSHVSLLLDSGVVIHAKFTGVDIDSIDHFDFENTIMKQYEYVGQASTAALEHRALALEGKNYDKLAFFGMGLYLLMKRSVGWAVPALSHWSKRGKFICTEFVDTVIGRDESNKQLTPGQFEIQIKYDSRWKEVV